MSIEEVLNFSEINYYSNPFNYFTTPEIFSNGFDLELLEWLETYDAWKLVEKDFYEQYDFSLNNLE